MDLPSAAGALRAGRSGPLRLLLRGAGRGREGWERQRRPELHALFEHYVYGSWRAAEALQLVEEERDEDLLQARFSRGERSLVLAVFLPEGTPRGVVLGLNKCGNASVIDDPRLVPEERGWIEATCNGRFRKDRPGRGNGGRGWPGG